MVPAEFHINGKRLYRHTSAIPVKLNDFARPDDLVVETAGDNAHGGIALVQLEEAGECIDQPGQFPRWPRPNGRPRALSAHNLDAR
eukprot:1353748-Pyramimonas_sp.AAC.1